jgi:hypothetical protein
MFSHAVLTGLQVLGVAIYVLDIYSKPAAHMSDLTGKSNKSVIRNGFGRNIWDLPFPTITRFYQVRSSLQGSVQI